MAVWLGGPLIVRWRGAGARLDRQGQRLVGEERGHRGEERVRALGEGVVPSTGQ
jgi:hypothetical protein